MATNNLRAARRNNPSLARLSAGHDPNTIYLLARNRLGEEMEVFSDRHDGTVAGVREAARFLQSLADAEINDWSMAASQMIATDEHGRAGWAVSPNLAHISRVGTDAAAYTLGDISRAPKKTAPKKTVAKRRNPSPRKYRMRQYDVLEWNVRSQKWAPLALATGTTPKYALEEFMASHPGYSPSHLRAEEIKAGAAPLDPVMVADIEDSRARILAEIAPWANGNDSRPVPVGRWAPIARDAKVSMSQLEAAAAPLKAGATLAVRARRLDLRASLGGRLIECLRMAAPSKVQTYSRFRWDNTTQRKENRPDAQRAKAGAKRLTAPKRKR